MYKGFSNRDRKLIFIENTESTNNDLKKLVYKEKEPLFAVLCADRQSGGRGRLGRSFFSPEGGLYFSFTLPLTGNEKNIPFITLLAGLAVRDAIEDISGVSTLIKWPNDIYLNGKKLGGILCELVSSGGLCAVVGIGINLDLREDDIPASLQDIMTSFSREKIPPPDKSRLIHGICERLDFFIYENNELFSVSEDRLNALRKYSCSIGKKVRYNTGDSVTEGIITDILTTGAAEMTLADGSKKEIFCGEITQ